MPRFSFENAKEGSTSWYTHKRKLILIFMCLIAVIVVDLSLVRIYDLVFKQFISISSKETLFGIVSSISIGLQILLLKLVRQPIVRHTGTLLRLIFESTRIIQCILSGVVVFIIFEVIWHSYYSTILLTSVIIISYSLCVCVLFALFIRMLNTTGLRTNIVILFLFALGSVTLNAAVAMVDSSLRLELRPSEIRPIIGGSMDIGKGLFNLLDDLYFITFLISFVFTWIATSVMLRYYRQKIGRIKFWLVAISPLIFFFAQFAYLLPGNFRIMGGLDPFFFVSMVTLIVLLSKPLGGTMLGIAFWSLSRSLHTDHVIRSLLIICGFGFLLLFTSNQALLLAIAPYPPFGTTTVMAIGLGAYMTVAGLYGSSIIIAQDAKLRQVIRKIAGSKLIDSLATGVVEKDIEGKVLQIVKQHANELENQTGVQPSLSDEEAKEYLKFVLEEIKKKET